MAALKKLFLIIAVLVAIAAAVPLLFPYDHYRPKLEQAMKDRLQADVTISSIDFSYMPKPHLALHNIDIGKSGEASIGEADIPLTMRNLLYLNHELTDIELSKAQLNQEFAISLPGRLKPNPGNRDVHFTSLRFADSNVTHNKSSVGPFSGVMKFNEDGTFKDVTLSDKDNHAELNVKPLNEKFALEFSAKNWAPPGPYDAHFDFVVMKGIADQNGVSIDEVRGMIFGAVAVGQAQLAWQDGWKLTGTLETSGGMHAEPLIGLVSDTTRTTGRLAGSATFEFDGTDYTNLFDKPQLAMKFTISDGEVHNMDLITPLRSQGASTLRRGGQTRFDSLTGTISYTEKGVTISDIVLNGGKLTSAGSISIDGKHKLSGRLRTKLSSGAIVVEAPLLVSGTVDSPEISSEGAYKPGGVTGTTQIF